MKILFKSLIDFFRDNGPIFAGSITCFMIMTIVPFYLLLVSIFGYFLGEHKEFYDFLAARLISFFPKATYEITEELKKIVSYKEIGIFTVVLYFYFSYQLYFAIEAAINAVFKIESKRFFLISILLSLFVITMIVVVITIAFGSTSFISMLTTLTEFFPGLKIGKITGFLIGFIIPIILIYLVAAILYLFIPRKKIMLRHALLGALFTAFFLESAKRLFTFYVVKVGQLGAIYGPLSAFVIFLLWVFYATCIFLIGAEIVKNLGSHTKPERLC